jgi:hypothetical protein
MGNDGTTVKKQNKLVDVKIQLTVLLFFMFLQIDQSNVKSDHNTQDTCDILLDYLFIAGYNQYPPLFLSFAIINRVHIPKQMIVYIRA